MYEDITSKIEKDILRKSIEYLFAQIIRLFYHITFVSTFFIYLYMSNDMRKILMRFISKKFRKNRIMTINTSSNKPVALHILKSINQSQ